MDKKDIRQKIRILIIGYSNNYGGVETFIKNVFCNINKEHFEMHFCCSDKIGSNYDLLKENNAAIHMVNSNRHNYLAYKKFWNDFFSQNKFDVVINNACDIVSIDVLKFAKKHNVPIRILHSHSSGNQMKMNIVHKAEELLNRKQLDKYVTDYWACSSVAGRWMFDKRKFDIISNGIDVNNMIFSKCMRDKIRQEFTAENKEIITFVGRMSKEKNPIKACDIFKEYSENHKAKMLLVGRGELNQEVQNRINNFGLKDDAIMVGSRSDISSILSASDCLIMTSDFEGLPFVLVEAQASGLPCVVSENVSKEAAITDLIEYVPNTADVTYWAEEVDKAIRRKIDRTKYPQMVRDAGFDIKDTAQTIEKIILGKFK